MTDEEIAEWAKSAAAYCQAQADAAEAQDQAKLSGWTAESYETWRESEPDCRDEDD